MHVNQKIYEEHLPWLDKDILKIEKILMEQLGFQLNQPNLMKMSVSDVVAIINQLQKKNFSEAQINSFLQKLRRYFLQVH